ncbi:MAG: tetratricopeptide repeat protein [Spirochaetia bacterium]|nr:tetratricopeptide repeat protein [Spirochaetia bacterium]
MTREKYVLVIPDKAKLAEQYASCAQDYEKALAVFVDNLSKLLKQAGLRPTIKSRVKQFESYYAKRLRLLKTAWTESSTASPVNDMLAVRVVCPFLGDLAIAENAMKEAFSIEEIERKGSERSFREFGYESIHVLVKIPEALMPLCKNLDRNVIEVQLRTILQEAWAEVEHELVYKAEFTPFDEPMKRKLAALNANLTLSDIIFQEILEYQKRLNAELAKRRQAFYQKIEEVSEPELADVKRENQGGQTAGKPAVQHSSDGSESKFELESFKSFGMDGLLLAALEAHNNADFDKAEQIYSEIILKKPEKEILAVVYKHRGMAYFAQSRYKEALRDFSACLILDPECYKALYYRGVVKSILEDYSSAIDDFSSALKIHPYHFFSRYRRALSYWKLGDTAQALADCEIALRIEPENTLARHLLNQIKERISQTDF